MTIKSTENSSFDRDKLRILIIILIILGIFFRFINIDKKIYWRDETYTSLRMSGYTKAELNRQVFNGKEIRIEDLTKFQHINSEKSPLDTIKGLATEEPHLPPLYFLMARFWVQWFGDSIAIIRSLSAILSLFAFPCIYWLCRELFDLPLVAWMAVGVIAISPFQVLYAQEARPYSLWTVTILLSSAALLRAMRIQTKLSWIIYAVTVVLGLYTFLLSGLVNIGQGIYVFVVEGCRFTKKFTAYLVVLIVGYITFTPWILFVISNFSEFNKRTRWTSREVSLFSLFNMWLGNLSRIFFDVGIGSDDPLSRIIPLSPFILILLITIGYAILFLYRRGSKREKLFILILIIVCAIPLVLPDLILGGRRSGIARYLLPCYLGIQLAVAYFLAAKISFLPFKVWQQKLWQVVTIAIFSAGVLSCAIGSQAQVWWNKDASELPAIAGIINQANYSLVVSDTNPEPIFALSYLLDPKVRLQLLVKPNIPKISQGFSDVFLYKPSDGLRMKLEKEQSYQSKPMQELGKFQDQLWKLEKQPRFNNSAN
ncbi:glycosyltransferase family 39 protein [Aerosakkonema sp. BLCC-F183]|uniref:glycosyltransferase family 39 protein n=1 Tax=Aerosakkonema sp. BLCC-F183 TaxID=3342834 RepID=UPI0035B8211C